MHALISTKFVVSSYKRSAKHHMTVLSPGLCWQPSGVCRQHPETVQTPVVRYLHRWSGWHNLTYRSTVPRMSRSTFTTHTSWTRLFNTE